MIVKDIKILIKQRNDLLKNDVQNEVIDEIEYKITNEFINRCNKFEVDFILETLTSFGQAPNVVYDDNGMFAVSSEGWQPVVTGQQRIEGVISVSVEKVQWKKTIRQALKHYLCQLEINKEI